MAFVKEEIPKEYKKEHNIEFADEWLIDRERNAIFYYTGGNPRGPETSFLLIWKGNNIKVGSIWHSTQDKNIIEWRDIYVTIPRYLEVENKEIIKDIKNALELFGFFCAKGTKGIINCDPKMIFQEDKGMTRWH